MKRLQRLRGGIRLDHEVLEIGPYHSPIAPKALGYRTTTLDLVDADALRSRAMADPSIDDLGVDAIEEVDLVGSACDLADLVTKRFGPDKRFDWILASHTIEHMPDPIRFLEECAKMLAPGGVLRMAVPDKRGCFDHFRPASDIAEWVQAYRERRTRPTVYQVFREECYRTEVTARDGGPIAWRLGEIPARDARIAERSLDLYRAWFGPGGTEPATYIDTHCWAFTPESFELLVRDTIAFGLVPMGVARISRTHGHEFFVDLRKTEATGALDERSYFDTRRRLLRRTVWHDSVGLSLVMPLAVIRRTLRKVRRTVKSRLGMPRARTGFSATPRKAA
jgi:SAM-dependent methyltransferase